MLKSIQNGWLPVLPKVNCSKSQSFYWDFFSLLDECIRALCFWILLHFYGVHSNQFHTNQWILVDIYPVLALLLHFFCRLFFVVPFIWFIYILTTFPLFIICGSTASTASFQLILFVFRAYLQKSFGCQIKHHCMDARTHASFIALIYRKRTEQTEYLIRLVWVWFWFGPSAMRLYYNKTFLDQNTDYVERQTHGTQRQMLNAHTTQLNSTEHSSTRFDSLLL